MDSISNEENTSNNKPRYFKGWNMVASGALIAFYVDGVGFWGFSGFFKEIIAEFGWSRGVAAVAPSLHRLEASIFAPFSGFIVDKWGARKTMLVGLFFAGLGFMALSMIQNLWQYYLVFVVIAFGLSAGSYVVVAALLNNWFQRNRGLAFSLLVLGTGSSAILGGLWIFVIPFLGWRTTLFIAGLGFWVLCIPLAYFVMRDHPKDYGLNPDGDIDEVQQEQEDVTVKRIPFKRILWSRSYLQYVAVTFLVGGSWSTITFAADILNSYGFSTSITAGIFVLGFAIPSLPARVLAGWLADRFDKRLVLSYAIFLLFIGTLLFAIANVPWVAILGAMLIGMGTGSISPVRFALQSEYWGPNVFGRLAGIQMGIAGIPAIASPVFLGFMFDYYGHYRTGLTVLAIPLLLSAILCLTIKKPDPEMAE